LPRIDLHGDDIVFEETAFRDRDGVREIPGIRHRDDLWRVPASWPAWAVIRDTFGDRLDVGDSLKEWVWKEWEHAEEVRAMRDQALDPDSKFDLLPEMGLYGFQQTGVGFMAMTGGCILADEMGTGKTVQAIAALEVLTNHGLELDKPVLVVCPLSAKAGWMREFARWAPHYRAVSVGGSADRRRKALEQEADIYLLHWDALRLHSKLARYGSIRLTDAESEPKELNRPWKMVIADEAHRALNPQTKQTRALWAASSDAEFRYALTGTPGITPDQLWALLHYVDPVAWPTKTKYMDRYCHVFHNPFGGMEVLGLKPDHAEEFRQLVDLYMLRRPKSLVLPQLPKQVWERRDIEMSPKQRRAYEQMRKGMMAELDGGVGMALDPLSRLARLTQLASSCAEINENGEIKLCAPSTKVEALVELLEDLGDAEPLVVFATSRQLIQLAADRLEREKIAHGLIVGGMSEMARWTAETDFQEGRSRVLLMTYGAGSEALTLTRARYVCFMQRSWKYEHNEQAEGRIHRAGQEAQQVTYIDLVAPGTVEENILNALDQDEATFQQIVRDKETLTRWLTV
jgi:SNF2 family DNA or RNA helicase